MGRVFPLSGARVGCARVGGAHLQPSDAGERQLGGGQLPRAQLVLKAHHLKALVTSQSGVWGVGVGW